MFSYLKSDPANYIILYSGGKKKKEGIGLSFTYFSPSSTLIKIPVNSIDIPFIFEELTADYQAITVQGQLTYRISDPAKTASILDFSLNKRGNYRSEDPKKPSERLLNRVKVYMQEELQQQSLQQALKGSEVLSNVIRQKIKDCSIAETLGLEVLEFNILALKPNPETLRALEATIREDLLKKADEALYDRRNSSVEQERLIKENEFNTQIAVEKKKKEVEVAKLNAKRQLQEQNALLKQESMSSEIELEEKNKELVKLTAENDKQAADSKAYALSSLLKSYDQLNPKMVQALSMMNMDSSQLIANAFTELAENAGKIGELNISPDLLTQLSKKAGK